MENLNKEYTLSLYFRQGDEFRHYLDENQGNVSAALRDLGIQLKSGYDTCIRLSAAFEGRNIDAFADADHISFEPGDAAAVGLLEMLAKEELVNVYEFEDEESNGEDDEDEGSDEDDEDSDDDDDDDDEADEGDD